MSLDMLQLFCRHFVLQLHFPKQTKLKLMNIFLKPLRHPLLSILFRTIWKTTEDFFFGIIFSCGLWYNKVDFWSKEITEGNKSVKRPYVNLCDYQFIWSGRCFNQCDDNQMSVWEAMSYLKKSYLALHYPCLLSTALVCRSACSPQWQRNPTC